MQIAIITKDRPQILDDTLARLKELNLDSQTLIVDGSEGSKTRDLCNEYDVSYHEQVSGGMVAARNEAIAHTDSEYLAFIDDDVIISDAWYETLTEELSQPEVKGATGKLLNEDVECSFPEQFIRGYLYGSPDEPAFIRSNGTIGGHFTMDFRSEVDHLPGCNMAYEVEALKDVGGFDTDFERGNCYREETYVAHQVSKLGKLIYNPEASLEHLKTEENRDNREELYTIPYNTRLFLYKTDLVESPTDILQYLFRTIMLNIVYFLRYPTDYRYYLQGEFESLLRISCERFYGSL